MDDRWFRRVQNEFCPRVMEYAGKPITYVELGCWEGASARWMCENVLTHPDAIGFGIDPYMVPRRHSQEVMDGHRTVAMEMLSPFKQWTWVHKRSSRALRRWRRSIDLLYIDGLHEASNVVEDFVLAWPHLKVGSGVIFDDYSIGKRKNFPHVPEGFEAVCIAYAGLVELWGKSRRQAGLKVIHKHCDRRWRRNLRKQRWTKDDY